MHLLDVPFRLGLLARNPDIRHSQISVPVQPGSSSGSLPENVNYAVKCSFRLGFLESVPEVSARLKEPETKERKFEDVVKFASTPLVVTGDSLAAR